MGEGRWYMRHQAFVQRMLVLLSRVYVLPESRSILAGGKEASGELQRAGRVDRSGIHPGFPRLWDHMVVGSTSQKKMRNSFYPC